MSRRPMRFARQVLALQIGLVVLITGVGFAVAATLLDRSLVDQYGQRALGVARSVAADDDLAAAVADPARHPRVATKAERVRDATGALFIVVTDDRGVRLAHPDPEQIGDPVSTDPQALAGREVVDVQRGTLGWSARGKVPLRTTDGRIVGQVSVGFDARQIHTTFLRLLGTSAAVAAGALLLGVAGSALLTRLLKRRTLGLEPHELTELVRQREAVLYGIGVMMKYTNAGAFVLARFASSVFTPSSTVGPSSRGNCGSRYRSREPGTVNGPTFSSGASSKRYRTVLVVRLPSANSTRNGISGRTSLPMYRTLLSIPT